MPPLAGDALTFALGVALAGTGGEVFVRGLVGLSRWLRLARGTVGLTLAAFATSMPELAVSTNAALDGRPQIGLGDALGSNVVNMGLILGAALLFAPMPASRADLRRDLAVAAAVPAFVGLLVADGRLSRIDGGLLVAGFLAWLAVVVAEAGRRRSAVEQVIGEPRHALSVALAVAGLAVLVVAGRLVVMGGTAVALALGLEPFVVGATVVSIGTTVPELATTLVARWRGHAEISLGTVLGSTIFNGLFIAGIAATIHPIVVDWREVAVSLVAGALVAVAAVPGADGRLGRRRGLLLLAFYAAFVTTLAQLAPRP